MRGGDVTEEILVEIAFEAPIIHWRGPSPFFFVAVPAEYSGTIREAARSASYGWGVVPVEAGIGASPFRTSLFPKGETYLLPLRVAVRKEADVGLGETVQVEMRVIRPSR